MKMEMVKDNWWKDNERRKTDVLRQKNLSQCRFVHHKSDMD
jgi:hypothetical protein